ncbi:MAG: transglycosylase domain-containing protein, partial [Bacilli bacterium]
MTERAKPPLHRPRRTSPDLDPFKWGRKMVFLFKAVVIMIAILIGTILLFVLYLRSQPLPPSTTTFTTVIYDQSGKTIDSLHSGENRKKVPLSLIPNDLKEATLAIEDHTFYEHQGFYMKGIARAVVANVKSFDIVQGASTITQQLAENLYLNHQRKWSIKFMEAIYTIQLELNYTKDQIFEKYLNEIYYGHAAYGVQAAAQTFYGKDVQDLNLAESSMLAGIPKGPKYFSPHLDFERAKSRQGTILRAMVTHQYITQIQADEAFAEELILKPLEQSVAEAPYFRDYITALAARQYGIEADAIQHGGLRIYTTLDLRLQQKAEEI